LIFFLINRNCRDLKLSRRKRKASRITTNS